jgi:hypothetical protein
MTTSGLDTVNLRTLTSFQPAMLCILRLIGNVVFVSTFVVLIRRHCFGRKLAHAGMGLDSLLRCGKWRARTWLFVTLLDNFPLGANEFFFPYRLIQLRRDRSHTVSLSTQPVLPLSWS